MNQKLYEMVMRQVLWNSYGFRRQYWPSGLVTRMQIHIDKWRVQKCKNPSFRWVAWRGKQKKKTGVVFDTWLEAITFAILRQELDYKMECLRTRLRNVTGFKT